MGIYAHLTENRSGVLFNVAMFVFCDKKRQILPPLVGGPKSSGLIPLWDVWAVSEQKSINNNKDILPASEGEVVIAIKPDTVLRLAGLCSLRIAGGTYGVTLNTIDLSEGSIEATRNKNAVIHNWGAASL